MEAVARRKPRHVDDLAEVTELRKWQVEVLGVDFVKALAGYANSDDSPYKPG
jgi:ribonuclease D